MLLTCQGRGKDLGCDVGGLQVGQAAWTGREGKMDGVVVAGAGRGGYEVEQ